MARRHRAARWGATALPDMRRTAVEQLREALDRPELAAERDMVGPRMERTATTLAAAELFWATEPMTRAALDASLDLPPWIPAATVPVPLGIIIWDATLPPMTSPLREYIHARWGSAARSPAGIHWAITGGELVLTPLYAVPTQPIIGIDMWEWRLPASEPVSEYTGEEGGITALFGASMSMMMIPTVATSWGDAPDGRDARLRARAGESPATVTTIDLRPLRFVPVEDAEETDRSGRQYRHRWVVRGHWRNQAHGPGRTERRPTWVPSYIKGPEGAPLLAREHVYTWRR